MDDLTIHFTNLPSCKTGSYPTSTAASLIMQGTNNEPEFTGTLSQINTISNITPYTE
jgi:hypothetical protein